MTQVERDTRIDGMALETLRAGLRGGALTSGDDGYEESRAVWNGMIDRRPAVIVRASGVADVIDAVGFAREQGLVVTVRGGGHGVAGNALSDGGLVVDLSLMKGVRVDAESRTVRAQGGVTLGDLDRETQAFGLAVPLGVVSKTGIAGLTLSGGMGWLRRKHGLAADNLVSVDVVTADGRFVTASESEQRELFWAIRGGGGSFGVVTSFEYRATSGGARGVRRVRALPRRAGSGGPALLRRVHERRSGRARAARLRGSCAACGAVPARGRTACPTSRWPRFSQARPRRGSVLLAPLRELGDPIVDLSGRCSRTRGAVAPRRGLPRRLALLLEVGQPRGAFRRGPGAARRAVRCGSFAPLDDRRLVPGRRARPSRPGGHRVRRPAELPDRRRGELGARRLGRRQRCVGEGHGRRSPAVLGRRRLPQLPRLLRGGGRPAQGLVRRAELRAPPRTQERARSGQPLRRCGSDSGDRVILARACVDSRGMALLTGG